MQTRAPPRKAYETPGLKCYGKVERVTGSFPGPSQTDVMGSDFIHTMS